MCPARHQPHKTHPDRTRMPRPNILLIHSDQHRYDCLGCHGHPLLRTPHLDRLAREGADYQLAFTPQPVCSPARACLVTGAWPTTHGCVTIPSVEAHHPARDDLPLLWQSLREAGYYQAHVGKFHGETAQLPDAYGVDRFVGEHNYAKWRREEGLADAPNANSWFGEVDPHIDAQQSRLGWGSWQTMMQIDRAAESDKPFFIRWDPSEPHLPNRVPEPFASMYDPDAVAPWPSFPDPLENKPFIQQQQRKTWQIDGEPWSFWAPVVARYLGEISLLDHHVGRVLDHLEQRGLDSQTMVIYTTDHGDLCGGHGMIDKHYVMYDDVVRVPLIVRWPGVVEPGSVNESFVSHELDLARTVLEVAGVDPPGSFVGENLVRLRPEDRPDIYAQYQGAQFGLYSERMIRDRQWKYVWNPVDRDELYDLSSDPGEVRNLARDPDCAEQLPRLRGRLIEWMGRVNDPLLNRWTRTQLERGLKV